VALSFGTDGVRGVAYEQLTTGFCVALGRAAADVFGPGRCEIGLDTRESGPALEAALATGLAAGGIDPWSLGVVPTPAVAYRSRAGDHLGAVISASHNVWSDNGIKLFAPGGRKLDDRAQDRVQERLGEILASGAYGEVAVGARPIPDVDEPIAGYLAATKGAIEGRRLDGLKVALDCAHGAASIVAGPLFTELGAEVVLLNAAPDGRNINDDCGSTHPDGLRSVVVESSADLGLAFDGDADRLIAVGHDGSLIDGDRIMGLMAVDMLHRGLLAHDTLVVTVMSNLGLRRAMSQAGVRLSETPVGDRYVLQALADGGFSLGGEQSGHLIFADLATTGDGLLSGVVLSDLVARMDQPSGELGREIMTSFPQVLLNVKVAERPDDVVQLIGPEIVAAEVALGKDGRVLVRASGTEPLVRVMVEAATEHLASQTAQSLVSAVRSRLG